MEINFLRKNIEIDQLNFKERAVEKIENFFSKRKDIDEINVITIYEKNPKRANLSFKVEIRVFYGANVIPVDATSDSQIKAFEYAFDKVKETIRREHDKLVSKKK
jgi:ribosome-associated translation inhibitor RaiA